MLLWRNKVFPVSETIDPSITENGRHRHKVELVVLIGYNRNPS